LSTPAVTKHTKNAKFVVLVNVIGNCPYFCRDSNSFEQAQDDQEQLHKYNQQKEIAFSAQFNQQCRGLKLAICI